MMPGAAVSAVCFANKVNKAGPVNSCAVVLRWCPFSLIMLWSALINLLIFSHFFFNIAFIKSKGAACYARAIARAWLHRFRYLRSPSLLCRIHPTSAWTRYARIRFNRVLVLFKEMSLVAITLFLLSLKYYSQMSKTVSWHELLALNSRWVSSSTSFSYMVAPLDVAHWTCACVIRCWSLNLCICN